MKILLFHNFYIFNQNLPSFVNIFLKFWKYKCHFLKKTTNNYTFANVKISYNAKVNNDVLTSCSTLMEFHLSDIFIQIGGFG